MTMRVMLEQIVRDDKPQVENDQKQPPAPAKTPPAKPKEIGGPKGPEPTRFGDWEQKGRATDF